MECVLWIGRAAYARRRWDVDVDVDVDGVQGARARYCVLAGVRLAVMVKASAAPALLED